MKLKNTTYAINAFYRPPNETQADHQLFLQTAENELRWHSYMSMSCRIQNCQIEKTETVIQNCATNVCKRKLLVQINQFIYILQ